MDQKYTVLLADDEEEVIDVIMQKVDWEGLGFHVIGSAPNGVKALELAEKFQPDVVMTDIKMPYMNGLELAEALRKEYPSTRILLFTGFDEFEYAREAIHLEVEEYILKPINAEELSKVLARVKASLDRDLEEKRNVEKLTNYYMESLPLLQTNYYTALIEGRLSEEEISRLARDYQISLEGPALDCVVFHTSEHHVPEGMTPLLLSMSVQQQIKVRVDAERRWKGRFFTHEGNTVMIAQLATEREVTELTDECDRFCRWAERVLDAKVTAGVGPVVTEKKELDESYRGAREAVSYRVLYGNARAINIREIAPMEAADFVPGDDSDIRSLFKSIHLGDDTAIRLAVDTYMKKLASRAKSVQQYEAAVMELLGNLYRFAAGNHIHLEDVVQIRSQGNLYETIPQMDIGTLGEWLLAVALSFAELLRNARNNTSKSYVSDAKHYVQENYGDSDLSLDKMCETLGVSSSYFSTVFKKETGNSFIGYLTDCRMKHAAELLLEGNEKNYSIARKVGYEDANYFSYVFKKAYGMSPSRYRAAGGRREKEDGDLEEGTSVSGIN